jgi:hypothetical protein
MPPNADFRNELTTQDIGRPLKDGESGNVHRFRVRLFSRMDGALRPVRQSIAGSGKSPERLHDWLAPLSVKMVEP